MAFKYGGNGSLTGTDALARSLGYLSLAIGVAELVAPGKIAKTFGLEGKEGLLRAFGAREIASGIGTLSSDPQPALWSRVAGDVVDMATLALGSNAGNQDTKRNVSLGIAAIAGIAALDAFAAALVGKRGGERPPPADYSDRSGLPLGPTASRGYYRQKLERGPAVAHRDARDESEHSGGAARADKSDSPIETDLGQAPIPAGVALG